MEGVIGTPVSSPTTGSNGNGTVGNEYGEFWCPDCPSEATQGDHHKSIVFGGNYTYINGEWEDGYWVTEGESSFGEVIETQSFNGKEWKKLNIPSVIGGSPDLLGGLGGKGLKFALSYKSLIKAFHKHHIIPKKLYKLFDNLADIIAKNNPINLKKLPNKFHGNHPAYTKWIQQQIDKLIEVGDFTIKGLKGLIKRASQEINKAYDNFKKTGGKENMNDYFKKLLPKK